MRSLLKDKFDNIREEEIVIIDMDKPNVYENGKLLDDCCFENVKTMEDIEKIFVHSRIREDEQWENIMKLYNEGLKWFFEIGVNYKDLKRWMVEDYAAKTGDYIDRVRVCNQYPFKISGSFSSLINEFSSLCKKYNCMLSLDKIDEINRCKPFSKIGLELKYENKIKVKVYSLIIGYKDYVKYNITKYLENGAYGEVFNDKINPELYNMYLEIKEERNKKVENTKNNTNNFHKIINMLQNNEFSTEEKLKLLKIIMK